MSFQDERRAIEDRFQTLWAAKTKIRWENIPWEEPKTDPEWVSLSITNGDGEQIELRENALHRFSGTIIVQVFTKEMTGTNRARELANDVATIFRRAEFSKGASGTIVTRTTSIRTIGINSGWFQMNAVTPFIRDAFHTQAA